MFSAFEWMVALRYLRARRTNGFVSVIVLFSFLGIVLGVATLIVVMSVMNGFHRELMDKILGVNGHAFVQTAEPPFTDWAEATKQLASIPGVTLAAPGSSGWPERATHMTLAPATMASVMGATSSGSTAISLSSGLRGFKTCPTPVIVPPVPIPDTTMSTAP